MKMWRYGEKREAKWDENKNTNREKQKSNKSYFMNFEWVEK